MKLDYSGKHLNDFYKHLSNLLDIVIVNTKQREALDYEILKLMHAYFLFELPENQDETQE